jgi:hypothetical protein
VWPPCCCRGEPTWWRHFGLLDAHHVLHLQAQGLTMGTQVRILSDREPLADRRVVDANRW